MGPVTHADDVESHRLACVDPIRCDPRPMHLRSWLMTLLIAAACIAALPALAEDDRTTLRLAVGASTVMSLQENRSTGYGWRLNADASRNLALVDIADLGFSAGAARGPIVGAPGERRFKITARQRGTATAVFDYARPWEHVAPARRHVVTLAIGR